MSEEHITRVREWLSVAEFGLKVIVLFLGIVAVLLLWGPLKEKFTTDIGEIEAFGIRLAFVTDQLEDLAGQSNVADSTRQELKYAIPSIENRLKGIGKLVIGSRILWLDENHPTSNSFERRLLQSLGLSVDMVQTPEDALVLLQRSCYDVIFSEMRRNDEPTFGMRFASELRTRDRAPGLIIYLMSLDRTQGTPAYVHGITNSPAELVHMVFDLVERRLSDRCVATAQL